MNVDSRINSLDTSLGYLVMRECENIYVTQYLSRVTASVNMARIRYRGIRGMPIQKGAVSPWGKPRNAFYKFEKRKLLGSLI